MILDPVQYGALEPNSRSRASIDYTKKQIALNKKNFYGKDIWFPVEFRSGKKSLEIDACTVGVNEMKTLVKTAVSERKGTVKEVFAPDDVRFTIKGFLIGKDRFFPEDQIQLLRDFFYTTDPVTLHGGYPELFLEESCRVIIDKLDWPEIQGKSYWIRPFSLTCETDYIEDLIIK